MAGSGIAHHEGRDEPLLVGRSGELDRLRQWLAETLGGSPRVVVLTGEAGTGKSRLVSELLGEAREAGVRPFAGRCLEDSPVPLLPFVAVLDALLPDAHTHGALGETVAAHPEDQPSDFGFAAQLSRALMAAASDRPLLLVIEDAQWADEASVGITSLIAATLAHEAVFRQLPAMLVVTARPIGPHASAQRLLARMSSETIGRTLRLGGLDDLDVFAMLENRLGARPSIGLLALVRDVTGGNPGEIASLLARLEQVGALEMHGREIVATVDDVSMLPVGSDIDAQLAALSPTAQALATTLALLRVGRISTLRAASDLPAAQFDEALDEALDARVLCDDGVRVDFADRATERALVRGLGGRRRQRLHADIAGRLAVAGVGNNARITASEIVEQLHRAGAAADETLFAQYARAAGDEALALGAYMEATRHYEAALRRPDLDDGTRAGLEERAALAAYRNLDRETASAHAAAAIEFARGNHDLATWGEAAMLRARAGFVTKPLDEFLDAAGTDEPGLRARVHGTLSELAVDRLRLDVAADHAAIAEKIVAEVDDPQTAARVEFVIGLQRFGALDLDDADAAFQRCDRHAAQSNDALVQAWARGRVPLVRWCKGALGDAAALASRIADDDRANGWWAEYSLVTATRAGIALAQGNLGAAEQFGAEAASAHRRSEQPGLSGFLWSTLACARAMRADATGAYAALREWEHDDPRPAPFYRALVRALTGDAGESSMWEPSPILRAGTLLDLPSLSMAAMSVELADALAQPELAANALEVLAAAHGRGIRFTPGWCFFVPRLAGVACMLADDREAAQHWLRGAQAEAAAVGAAGEAARSEFDVARVAIRSGDDDVADTLDRAIAAFDRLGYRQLLTHAQRLAGKSETETGAAAVRLIMVTDLVDSTPLARRVGNQRFLEVLREHNRIVRARLRQFDGVEFKHTGDGIAAWFLSAGAAIECALRIQRDIEQSNRSRHDDPLSVRIGLSAGEVVSDDRDMFGLAVIAAFRVCDHAHAGRVVVSSAVPVLVRDAQFEFASIGDVVLKGFADADTLYSVSART